LKFVFVDVKTGDNLAYKDKNDAAIEFKRRLELSLKEFIE
jgi:hypothetical protein